MVVNVRVGEFTLELRTGMLTDISDRACTLFAAKLLLWLLKMGTDCADTQI